MYKLAILILFFSQVVNAGTLCYTDCKAVRCALIKCAPGYISVKPPCKCCNECQKISETCQTDCTTVLCPLIKCAAGYVSVKPPCKCCNECQKVKKRCSREGEEFKFCGSPCEATCFSLRFKNLIKCPKPCRPGCFCKDGLVRDSKNNCIRPEQCNTDLPQCRPDEQYYECIPSCSRTCERILSKNVILCNQLCRPGCFCKEGLVLNNEGKCVLPQECTSITIPPVNTCGKDEVYNECGSACPPTCSTLGKTDLVCTSQCVQGCFCRNGLVRNELNECVQPNQCPKSSPIQECKKGEQYYDCIPTCKNTCENYKAEHPICPRICIKGCACRAGLVRRKDGECVEPIRCDNTPPTVPMECKIDCTRKVCPIIDCIAGYVPKKPTCGCCDVCVPVKNPDGCQTDCSGIYNCPQIRCKEGYELVKQKCDCCETCQKIKGPDGCQTDCSGIHNCPQIRCKEGYELVKQKCDCCETCQKIKDPKPQCQTDCSGIYHCPAVICAEGTVPMKPECGCCEVCRPVKSTCKNSDLRSNSKDDESEEDSDEDSDEDF